MEYELKTKRGYNYDEVISALQKEIRRCNEEHALYWALELIESGFHKALARRLVIIAHEDIGLTSPEICQWALQVEVWTEKAKNKDPVVLTAVLLSLVRSMAISKKSRETDNAVNYIIEKRKRGFRLEIPDYAIDKHTKRGRKLGKGIKEFWEEGAKINNKKEGDKYEKRLYKMLGFKFPE